MQSAFKRDICIADSEEKETEREEECKDKAGLNKLRYFTRERSEKHKKVSHERAKKSIFISAHLHSLKVNLCCLNFATAQRASERKADTVRWKYKIYSYRKRNTLGNIRYRHNAYSITSSIAPPNTL
jgi:hypothetical protein